MRKDDGEAADTEKVEEPSAKIKSAVKDEKKVVDTEPNETTQVWMSIHIIYGINFPTL